MLSQTVGFVDKFVLLHQWHHFVVQKIAIVVVFMTLFYGLGAAILTAQWAIVNRSASLEAFLGAFVVAGILALLFLLGMKKTVPTLDSTTVVLSMLLATYQALLWLSFNYGSKVVQAIVNLNVPIILILDKFFDSEKKQPVEVWIAAISQALLGIFIASRKTE